MGYVNHAMEDAFQENEWGEYGGVGDHLAPCISLGDNFIVNLEDGNSKGINFVHKDDLHFQTTIQMPMGAKVQC